MNFGYGCFHTRGRIHCGVGKVSIIGEEISKSNVSKVLLITEKALLDLGIVQPVIASLDSHNIEYEIFSEVEADPSAILMDRVGKLAHESGAGAIVGVGGGSSLDTAKAAAIIAANPGHSVIEYLGDYTGHSRHENPAWKTFAVPTTAGTGSEASWNISVNDTERKVKSRIQTPFCIPDVSVLDASLMKNLPVKIAASTGIDAFTHCFEAYVSTKGAWIFSDILAEQGMQLIANNIRPFVADTSNTEAGQNMMLAAMIGGMCLSQAPLGIVHQTAKPLGARFHVPHGLANSLMLPHVMNYTVFANPKKFAKTAKILGVDTTRMSQIHAAKSAIAAVKELCVDLGLPCRLREIDIPEDALEMLANDAMYGKTVFDNPCKGTVKDILSIYKAAY